MVHNKIRQTHRGFTLVEVLVVISITAILLALLIPSLSEARTAAKDAKCLANVRSLGQSGFMYANDFKQSTTPQVIYPSNFNYTPAANEDRVMGTYRWAYWADCLNLYLTTEKAFDCPLGSTRTVGSTIQKLPWGYAQNPFIYPVDSNGARTSAVPKRVDAFRNPHTKFYYVDTGFSTISNIAGTSPREYFSPYLSADFSSSSDNRSSPAIRHNLRNMPDMTDNSMPDFDCGFNAVFFDGHAAYVDWPTVIPRAFGGGGSTVLDRTKRNEFWLP
jgi:prepilin-type N-terminal cleavage/methylation domain-containing protein